MSGAREESGEDRLVRLVHDLRTPLTLVLGFADLLRQREAELTPEQRAEFVGRIDDAAKDLKRILDEERAERQDPGGAA